MHKQQSIFFSKKLIDSNEFFVDWKEWENLRKKMIWLIVFYKDYSILLEKKYILCG